MATRATRNRLLAQGKNPGLQNMPPIGNKRPLEDPQDGNQKKKRVFGDITNKDLNAGVHKKNAKVTKVTKKGKTVVAVPRSKKLTRENSDLPSSQTSVKSEDVSWDILELSQESNKSVEDRCDPRDESIILSQDAQKFLEATKEPLDDVDAENMKDPYQVSLYSRFIFNYYKQREAQFMIDDYLKWQTDITGHMRGILVDWLVEVQENFELNHETLYLAVKLVDLYLSKKKCPKERLQLIGATSLFIACKFDERCPPVLDDFLYICDDAYQRDELLEMERLILHAVGFDLGSPLSYRFLRRYAKCGRCPLITLTLARYILETSQMHYNFIHQLDSHRAAACLLLAMKMDGSGQWTRTLVHYTGYTEAELLPVVKELNQMIASAATSKFSTIRIKYSHRVFHEVAKVPALKAESLSSPSKLTPTIKVESDLKVEDLSDSNTDEPKL